MVGDQCRHGLASRNTTEPNPNWQTMLDTFTEVMAEITEAFPNIPILPVIGNNDVVYHDQAPTAAEAPQYYNDMWNVWVTGVPVNN